MAFRPPKPRRCGRKCRRPDSPIRVACIPRPTPIGGVKKPCRWAGPGGPFFPAIHPRWQRGEPAVRKIAIPRPLNPPDRLRHRPAAELRHHGPQAVETRVGGGFCRSDRRRRDVSGVARLRACVRAGNGRVRHGGGSSADHASRAASGPGRRSRDHDVRATGSQRFRAHILNASVDTRTDADGASARSPG